MTRITHTKEVALGDNALVADGADILSYWMQAETACLVASC
jgi:hypothetical protein